MTERTRTNLVVVSGWLIAAFVAAMLAAMYQSAAHAQSSGPVNTPLLNKAWYFVGTSPYATTIQSAVTAACASSPGGAIVIPAGVAPSDTIGAATGGCTKAWILDQRAVTEACYSWSGSAYTATACATGTLTPGGGNYAIQYDNGGALGGVNFTGLVWNNGSSNPPSQANVTNVGTLGTLSNSTTGNAATSTSFAATPSQCTGGTPISSGIAANGNANCIASSGVTSLSVATANGISGSFSSGSTPVLTLALGAINPSSIGATTPAPGTFSTFKLGTSSTLTGATGTDTKLVTGAAGTSNDIGIWSASGDLIDSLKSINNIVLLNPGSSVSQTISGVALAVPELSINGSGFIVGTLGGQGGYLLEDVTNTGQTVGHLPSYQLDTFSHIYVGDSGTALASLPTLAANNAFTGTNTFAAISATKYSTATSCYGIGNPTACSSSSAGGFAIGPANSSVVIDTTAVTTSSQIDIWIDNSLSTAVGTTCAPTTVLMPYVSSRVAGTSFTVTLNGTVAGNPECFGFFIHN